MLGMLALAPHGARSRRWLREKLWPGKSNVQSSASLRQVLLELRRAIGPTVNHYFHTDKNTVSINTDHVVFDHQRALDDPSLAATAEFHPSNLMASIDLADDLYMAWLNGERSAWARKFELFGALDQASLRLQPSSEFPVIALPTVRPRVTPKAALNVRIALLPPSVAYPSPQINRLIPDIYRLLAKSLADLGDYEVIEPYLPASAFWSGNLPVIGPQQMEADLCIGVYLNGADGQQTVTLALVQGRQPLPLWSSETHVTSSTVISMPHLLFPLIAGTVDAAQNHLLSASDADADSLIHGRALARMLDLSATDIDAAEATLRAEITRKPTAQAHALLSFLMTFRVGQRFQAEDVILIEASQYHADAALALGPDNCLVATLCAYVRSYLFGEHNAAAEQFERALRLNPTYPLAWDLYAMLNAYTGTPARALRMANWACELGAHSPQRYYFQTTRAITACFSGEHQVAVEAGEMALRERPSFNSILRVLVSSYAHLGKLDEAAAYLLQLRQIEPDFSIKALRDARYPGLDTEGGRHFIDGLLAAGVTQR